MDLAHRTRHSNIPLDSPASASSSTLITTPLPVGRSKESLRLPSLPSSSLDDDTHPDAHVNVEPAPRPRLQIGTTTTLPPTRMSASGFVEPHHSNVPRRVRVRTRTKTGPQSQTQTEDIVAADTKRVERLDVGAEREKESEERDSEGEAGLDKSDNRTVKELRRTVKEALTPGRRWSDSEGNSEHDNDDARDSDTALTPENAIQKELPAGVSLPANVTESQSLYAPGRPTPTSSRNLNTERTPMHLLSLRLPPLPSPGSPTGVSMSAPLGGVPLLVPHFGQPQQTQLYPQTAPPLQGAFAVPLLQPQTLPMPHTSTLPTTSSLRPGTLPRRRRPAPATPTPKAKPARTSSSDEEEDAKASAPVVSSSPPATTGLSTSDNAPETPKPKPAHIPTPAPGQAGPSKALVGVRFHGHHSHSSASARSSSSSSLVKGPAQRQPRGQQQTPNGKSEPLKATFDLDGARIGRRNTVSVGAKEKGDETEKKRSRSLVDRRSRARTQSRARSARRDGASPSKAGRSEGTDKDERSERGRTQASRAAARETRREERSRGRTEREERRRDRREMEERMCVQRVGARGRVEVAFFADDGHGYQEGGEDPHKAAKEREEAYVLLQVVEPDSDSEDEDEWDEDEDLDLDGAAGEEGQKEQETPIAVTTSPLESPSSPARTPTSSTPIPGPQVGPEPTKEPQESAQKELRLYLPTDLSKHIDGVPALSPAQVREGCDFIQSILAPSPSTTSVSTTRPRRVRVIAPRARPEDAWAVALCYQAGLESAVTTSAAASVKTTTTTTTTLSTTATTTLANTESALLPSRSSAGAARLIATTNANAIVHVPELSREAVRRSSVPVPVPPLALVRGEDGEVERVVEVAVDVETLDVVEVSDSIVPALSPLASVSSPFSNLNANPATEVDTDAVSEDEDTFMLHPTYTYSAVHRLAMRLLDEGAGEWHTRGKQWEERVERMQHAAGAVFGPVKSAGAGTAAVFMDLKRQNVEVRRHVRQERQDEEEADNEDGEDDEGDDSGDDSGSDSEEEDEFDAEEEEEDDEEDADLKSAGARQGSESSETNGNLAGADAAYAADDGEHERGRTNEPHTRAGHGVPMPSKYEEPSSAFVSSAHGRSKSRARSKSKAASKSKSRARSMSVSASASKANGIGRRKSRLSMNCDSFLDDGDDDNGEEAVVDKATKKARRAELRRLRLIERRARKEAEEVEAYTGIRMEWRGVLSFDGLQKLVGVWTPASAAR